MQMLRFAQHDIPFFHSFRVMSPPPREPQNYVPRQPSEGSFTNLLLYSD